MSQHYGTEPVNFTITFERPGNLNSSKHYKTLKDSGNSSTKSMIIGISWHCSTPRQECMLWQQFTCTVELVFDHFFALYRTLLVFFQLQPLTYVVSTPKKGQSKNSKKNLFCKNNAEKKSNSFQQYQLRVLQKSFLTAETYSTSQ